MRGSLDHISWKNSYLLIIVLRVKQNINYVWFLGPFALGKLTPCDTYLSIKQTLNHAQLLRPHIIGTLALSLKILSTKAIMYVQGELVLSLS